MKIQIHVLLLAITILLQLHFILPTSSQTTLNFLELGSMDAKNAFSIRKIKSHELSVYSIGDINGDGINDLIIGPPTQHYMWDPEIIYVLYGGAESFGNLVLSSEGNNSSFHGLRIQLKDPYFRGIFWSVSSFGDFNKDGNNDLIIQITSTTAGVTTIKGILIFGKERKYKKLILGPDIAKTEGIKIFTTTSSSDEITSYSVIKTGDINNDGIDDGLIQIQQRERTDNPDTASKNGIIYTMYGNTSISDDNNLESLPSSSKFRIYDKDSNEMLPIECIGDINHDGVDDFAARSSVNGGNLYVIYGKIGGFSDMNVTDLSNSQGFRIKGGYPPNSTPTYHYSYAGDLNCDDIDDLIIGMEGNISFKSLYIVYGKVSGLTDIDLDSLTPSKGFRVIESGGNEYLGLATSVGDIDNDGFDDILINSFNTKIPITKNYIIFGQTDRRPDIDVTVAETLLAFQVGAVGYDPVDPIKAGDLNGDGIDDIVLKTKSVVYGLYGSNCEKYTDCLSPMPSICYASKGCACRKKKMIMQGLSCIPSCSPGYYQASNSTCKICSENCKECSSNSVCETCFDGYLLQDSVCVNSCFDGYLKIGSSCRSTGIILGATAGAVTGLVIVIMATVYIRRNWKRIKRYPTDNDRIPFPLVRLDSEIPMTIAMTPGYGKKDSYLEQPIEHIKKIDGGRLRYAMREEEDENNNEGKGIGMNDQQKAEYEVRAKRAEE